MSKQTVKIKLATVVSKECDYCDCDNTTSILQGVTDWVEVTWAEYENLREWCYKRGKKKRGYYTKEYWIVFTMPENQEEFIPSCLKEYQEIMEKEQEARDRRKAAAEKKKQEKEKKKREFERRKYEELKKKFGE